MAASSSARRKPAGRPSGRPKPGAAVKNAAPAHLEAATAAWWRSVVADFELEDHHVRLLTLAAEAWDRAQQARVLLAKAGPVINDRFGQPRAHPAVAIERDARVAFARLVRELDLDAESLPGPRPPRRGRR